MIIKVDKYKLKIILNICLKHTFLNIHLMYFTQNEIAILLCSYVADHIYICKMFIY